MGETMTLFDDELGLLTSTSIQSVDDDPETDERGYATLYTPEEDDGSEDTDDDVAFRSLRETGLSPEEAQAAVDYMRPLNEEEEMLLDDPALKGLYKVDDALHQQRLIEKTKQGTKAMDRAKEDATYGDPDMNQNEERMERQGVDSTKGWGWKSPFKAATRGFKSVAKIATMPARMLSSAAMRFVPGRDARKAALLRNTYKKLWYEHANWLAVQDKNARYPLKPRVQYEQVSKLWAKDQMRRNKLPTSFVSGESSRADALAGEILGESMGSWWWPFGTFLNLSRTTINNTADRRAGAPPEEQQNEAAPPETQDVPAEPTPEEEAAQAPVEEATEGWNDFVRTRLTGVFVGEDSLGEYATQILGKDPLPAKDNPYVDRKDPLPAKDNPYVDRIVQKIAIRLNTGGPISAGELGLLSSAAKEGHARAQKIIVALKSHGAVLAGDDSGMDPWLYKLNPVYWFSSRRKREFTDAERTRWKENAALQKHLVKQKEDLDAAERAARAAAAVESSKAQAAETEAKLKEIATSLKGSMAGSFVGHDKPTTISQVVANALEKAGKKQAAGRLYAKIKTGLPLNKDELHEAHRIAGIIGRVKVVHGDLIADSDEALAMHGTFVGACALGAIDEALKCCGEDRGVAEALSRKIASGQEPSQQDSRDFGKLTRRQEKLRKFTKSLVTGKAFVGCKQAKSWTAGAFVGAAQALNAEDKKMLSAIAKLAKIGNPRAQKALAALRRSGVVAGDVMGLSVGKFFKYATAPVWLPAKGIYKAAKWTGQQLGIVSKGGGSSPEQVRLAQMAAARKRREAAAARAAAADAQTAAEERAQQAIAAAADAEADAKDAEALAKEQAMRTKEIEADPGSIAPTDESDGEFIGGWASHVGRGTTDAKIVVKANEVSPTGIKIRAGNRLYRQAKAGNPKAVKAIEAMVAKAKAGDQQALRDVNAVKAGKAFAAAQARAQRKQVAAAKKAQRKQAIAAVREARRKKVVALQKRYESRIANRLCRMSRKHELRKHWKVERMAAAGHPKAKVYVAKQVALSKQGDKKALARVQAMKQGRLVRQKVRTPREIRNMRQAERFVRLLARNNPKTVRQYEILKAAANKGNPNAIRAIDRIMLAAMVVSTVNRGTVVYRKPKKTDPKKEMARKGSPARKKARQQVAVARGKAAAGTASREELAAGAKAAHALGDEEEAGRLVGLAAVAPSATETIKKKAATVAAAEAGNPEAKAELAENLAGARKGDPNAVKEIGKAMAVDTVAKIDAGQPVSPTMRDALVVNERIKAGDPVAVAQAREIAEQATKADPASEATLAAGALVAAKTLDQSLAAKPRAKAELLEKAIPPIPEGEKGAVESEVAEVLAKANAGTVTAEEGQRGVALALRLRKPRLAAEISAKSPPVEESEFPLSSLPDQPLPPITGFLDLVKESVKALALATPDPLANYRSGLVARSRKSVEPDANMGWSAFNFFRPFLPGLAMASMPVMAVTSLASLIKKPQAQKVVVQMPPPAAPAAAVKPTTPAAKPNPHEAAESSGESEDNTLETLMRKVQGDDELEHLMRAAIVNDKVSRMFKPTRGLIMTPEGHRASILKLVAILHQSGEVRRQNLLARAQKGDAEARTELQKIDRSVPLKDKITAALLGDSTGADAFQDLVANALKTKKMSKDDFNRATKTNLPPNADEDTKKASAIQLLKFLEGKGVKVG
jgi:hypothetical protein